MPTQITSLARSTQTQPAYAPDVQLKGAAFYTVSRSLQIRRSRLPKPQVKHGQRPS